MSVGRGPGDGGWGQPAGPGGPGYPVGPGGPGHPNAPGYPGGPGGPGWHQGPGGAHPRPDATDPDLAPIPPGGREHAEYSPSPSYGAGGGAALADTGQFASYPDGGADYPDGATDIDDHEAIEDGLQGLHDRGEAVAARLSRRPRDMVLSIGVLLAVVFAMFGLYQCLGGDEVVPIDPSSSYSDARASDAFTVVEPVGLSDDWRPVSAQFQPQDAGTVLRVGYRTPDDDAIQLVQGNLSPDLMLSRELGANARETGRLDVNGRSWAVYSARKGERALVLLEAGRTVIIVGQADQETLQKFAATLR